MLKKIHSTEQTVFLASNLTQNSALQGCQLCYFPHPHFALGIPAFSLVVGSYIFMLTLAKPKIGSLLYPCFNRKRF